MAQDLHAQGFSNLYLATGLAPDSFPHMPWIKQVVGKEPPQRADPLLYFPSAYAEADGAPCRVERRLRFEVLESDQERL